MSFPQSSRAYADMAHPEAWGFCDRCGMRYLHKDLAPQFEWRGNALCDLNILVCTLTCIDVPQDQLRTVIIGPDPVPVFRPRPGFQSQQQGYTPAVNILELLDGDLIPGGSGGSGTLGNDGGVLYLTSPPSGYPTSDLLVPGGGFYSNGGEISIAPGSFTAVPAATVTFGGISANQLLSLGARGLPLTQPPSGSGILWNPWGTSAGGPVYIA